MSPTSRPAVPLFDPAAALPELAELRHAAERADWPAVAALFENCPDEYGRIVLADTLAELPGIEQLLDRVLGWQPGHPLAVALLADRHIHLGWEARTSSRAKDVTPAQWKVFREHLNRAEQLLISATAHNPGHALAWSLRLTVAMGLSLGQSESLRRYRNLARAVPHPYGGQRQRLQQLLPKWGGSWEAAREFVQECFRTAPAGSLAGALVAQYHVERWSSLDEQARREYVRRVEVRQELLHAAAGSVLHADCRARFGFVTAHSTFAMLASLAGDHAAAAAHFRAIGPYGHTYPWSHLGRDAEAVFIEHRDRALAKG